MVTQEQQQPLPSQPITPSLGERLLGASGIVVLLCLLAAGFASPDPPAHGAPDTAVLAFYQQHLAGLATGAFLWDLGMAALVLLAVVLSRACEAAYLAANPATVTPSWPVPLAADCMRLFSAIAATLFIVSQAVLDAGAVIASHGAPASSVRVIDEVSHLTGHLATLPLGGFLMAAGIAQVISRRGARWLGWLGIVAGGTLVITTSWVAIGHQWVHNAGVFGLLGFMFWSAATSISLLRLKSSPRPQGHAVDTYRTGAVATPTNESAHP